MKIELDHHLPAIKALFHPIHKQGHLYITLSAIFTLAAFFFFGGFFAWLLFFVTLFVVYFFRDPARTSPTAKGLVLSPADGIVQNIEEATPPEELELEDTTPRQRISIFLNTFDVHVQRVPTDGEVTKVEYFAGKFLNASLDKASKDNERNSIVIKTEDGKEFICVQIAGLVARRIVCDAYEEDKVYAGERYGIIKFGSRVDLYLPPGIEPLVLTGQRMIAGETIVADMSKATQQPYEGIMR